jgi:S-adenosylmethionine-dependent methyltransferase
VRLIGASGFVSTDTITGVETVKVPDNARTAVVWAVITAELAADAESGQPQRVVDVGGGTGGFAVPLAQAGYLVTVVDPSPNALAGLTRRAVEAGVSARVTAVQGDADSLAGLVEPAAARLVLCHSVLEMVDSPADAVHGIAAALAPGGAASLLVANRAGAALSRAVNGHVAAASAILADPQGRIGEHDTLLRRFDPETLSALVSDCGLHAERWHGVHVASDLTSGGARETEAGAVRALREFELSAAARSPYRDVAGQLHMLARKPSRPASG